MHTRPALLVLLLAAAAVLLSLQGHAAAHLLFLLPLYARLGPNRVLESARRARILGLVEGRPGLSLGEVGQILGIGWGTAVHHLNRMERAGVVVSQSAGRHRRFFARSSDAAQRDATCALADERAVRLLHAIEDEPGINQSDLCARVSLPAPVAHKYLDRLRRSGLISSHREWRNVRYHATAEGPLPRGIGGDEGPKEPRTLAAPVTVRPTPFLPATPG